MDQMEALENGADKVTGKVTPYGMAQILSEKYHITQQTYQKFIDDST